MKCGWGDRRVVEEKVGAEGRRGEKGKIWMGKEGKEGGGREEDSVGSLTAAARYS